MRYQLVSNPKHRRRRRMPGRNAHGRFVRRTRNAAYTLNPRRRRPRRRRNQTYHYAVNPRRRRRRRNPLFLANRRRHHTRRYRSNPGFGALLNPKAILSDLMRAVPQAAVLTGGIFASWIFAKSVLNRGGRDRDSGMVGYGMNVAGGLLYAVLIGAIFRKREWFTLGVTAALTAPLLRFGVSQLQGKNFTEYGIRTGFEDYVLVGPGMSDFLTLAPRGDRMGDWLTTSRASQLATLSGIVDGDTIKRYGDE